LLFSAVFATHCGRTMTDYVKMTSPPPGASLSLPAKDPFYVVKEKVQSLIGKLSQDFEQWKETLANSNTYRSSNFKPLTQQVKVALKTVNVDLRDLEQTIKIVDANRDKFKDITDAELASRKKFVNEMRVIVQDVTSTLSSPKTKAKLERDQSEALMRTDSRKTGLEAARHEEGADFVEGKRLAQAQIEAKQDVVLEDMEQALGRLTEMSKDIGTGLKESNEMLNQMDGDLDENLAHMNIVMKKLGKLLQTSDTGKICCIIALFALALILFFVLVSP